MIGTISELIELIWVAGAKLGSSGEGNGGRGPKREGLSLNGTNLPL
jgi:hypothetical protein